MSEIQSTQRRLKTESRGCRRGRDVSRPVNSVPVPIELFGAAVAPRRLVPQLEFLSPSDHSHLLFEVGVSTQRRRDEHAAMRVDVAVGGVPDDQSACPLGPGARLIVCVRFQIRMLAELFLDALPFGKGVHHEAVFELALGDDHLEPVIRLEAVTVLLRHRKPALAVEGQ